MKKIFNLLLAMLFLAGCNQHSNAINDRQEKQDTLTEVSTIGVFDGVFIAKTGYRINEYYIKEVDIKKTQIDSLTGKKVLVKGKLEIPTYDKHDTIHVQRTSDERKFIRNPVFKLVDE